MELDSLQQLRELPADDLRQKTTALRKELFMLRINQVSGRVERPSQFRELRRQLARMLTVLGQQTRQAPPAAKVSQPPARRTGAKRSTARKTAVGKSAS